jgi:hypothetical protein
VDPQPVAQTDQQIAGRAGRLDDAEQPGDNHPGQDRERRRGQGGQQAGCQLPRALPTIVVASIRWVSGSRSSINLACQASTGNRMSAETPYASDIGAAPPAWMMPSRARVAIVGARARRERV